MKVEVVCKLSQSKIDRLDGDKRAVSLAEDETTDLVGG
jgi:hypothetical protein